jgi:hypothetical protein
MQAHPDRAELKAYLRGRLQSAVAGAIKAHLLTCDQCVSDAVLECDYLDQMRARFALRSNRDREAMKVFAPPLEPAVIAMSGGDNGIHHAWAALIPMTLAVGFLFSTRAWQERPPSFVEARTTQAIEQPLVRTPSVQENAEEEVDRRLTDNESDKPSQAVITPVHVRNARQQARIRRAFILSHYGQQTRPMRHPVLLGPAEFDRPVMLSNVSFHKSEALSLVTTEPSLSPPPRRKSGFRRFFSAFAAPFRS